MMTTQPNTKLKWYKVTFEQQSTGKIFEVVVEAANAKEAGDSVLANAGKGYDLVMSIGAKKADLQ